VFVGRRCSRWVRCRRGVFGLRIQGRHRLPTLTPGRAGVVSWVGGDEREREYEWASG